MLINQESTCYQARPSTLVSPLYNRPLTSTSIRTKQKEKESDIITATKKLQREDFPDAFSYLQARQRLEASLTRRALQKKKRADEIGDPIRGKPTPFVESFDDYAREQIIFDPGNPDSKLSLADQPTRFTPENLLKGDYLNHYITPTEYREALEYSRILTEPVIATDRSTADPEKEREARETHAKHYDDAVNVMARIVSMSNSNSKERTRVNIQRCIDTFGRHKTDEFLKPKPTVPMYHREEALPRAGPDTGSSEVQIAILTIKIKKLADMYQGRHRMDKVNKRNLRLLLHRRQKLLKYLNRRERAGERWKNCIETLGLTEATWKGQIAVE